MSTYNVSVNGKTLELTNLEKVFWPEKGLLKGDLIKYYYEVSPWILPHLRDRPIVMKRYPDGIEGKSFYQKRCPEYAPPWLETVAIGGGEESINYCLCNNEAALVWLINQGCIEIHPWLSSTQSLSRPDFMVFDLDPSEGVSFSQVIEVALAVKECLDLCRLTGFLKTSGASGIHIYVPLKTLYSYAQVREAAKIIAELVCSRVPALATVERTVRNRTGKVYVDYLQNGEGKTIASVYSVRPVPAASVSMPLSWEEIETRAVEPDMFTIESVRKRLEERGDLFSPVLGEGYSLDFLLKDKTVISREQAGKP